MLQSIEDRILHRRYIRLATIKHPPLITFTSTTYSTYLSLHPPFKLQLTTQKVNSILARRSQDYEYASSIGRFRNDGEDLLRLSLLVTLLSALYLLI